MTSICDWSDLPTGAELTTASSHMSLTMLIVEAFVYIDTQYTADST